MHLYEHSVLTRELVFLIYKCAYRVDAADGTFGRIVASTFSFSSFSSSFFFFFVFFFSLSLFLFLSIASYWPLGRNTRTSRILRKLR